MKKKMLFKAYLTMLFGAFFGFVLSICLPFLSGRGWVVSNATFALTLLGFSLGFLKAKKYFKIYWAEFKEETKRMVHQ